MKFGDGGGDVRRVLRTAAHGGVDVTSDCRLNGQDDDPCGRDASQGEVGDEGDAWPLATSATAAAQSFARCKTFAVKPAVDCAAIVMSTQG